MTVGQRIAQKRRELGLSQEGLGEKLGVSRQAIYKWESDAALPEIEKLVNLSREFGVSVGWLLGEEDGAPERPELTAEQLRMVEEIVGRYLAAQPAEKTIILRETVEAEAEPEEDGEAAEKPKPPKRRRWPWVLAGLVLVGVFFNLFSRLDQMRQENQNLQMAVANVRSDVNSQIYSITRRVEEVLQSQNSLTAEQSAEVTATDYRANTVTISARALPRTYVEGMTAEFILTSDGETVTVPGTLGKDHAFTGALTGPLSDEIGVSVVLLTGDQRETQLLNEFFSLYSESFPLVMPDSSLWGSSPKVREYADARIVRQGTEAKISSIRLGLFRDGKLLAWYKHLDEQPRQYQGSWPDTEFFQLEGEWTMEPDHEYCVAAVVVDEYGRERIYPDGPVVYHKEEGFADYVESGTVTWDPADWDY